MNDSKRQAMKMVLKMVQMKILDGVKKHKIKKPDGAPKKTPAMQEATE